jgi:hypothetical protein
MTSKNKYSSRRWRAIWSGLLLLLTAFPLGRAAAQGLPLCSWPFEVTGQGLTNIATPDTNATYWVMPVDTSRWSMVMIGGRYPNARFFNISTYQATGALVDSIDDESIAPASGANPFVVKLPLPKNNPFNTYHLQISRSPASAGNNLGFGASRLQFIVYRVYAADSSYDRTGGAQVPSVTLVASNGTSRQLRPCPFGRRGQQSGQPDPAAACQRLHRRREFFARHFGGRRTGAIRGRVVRRTAAVAQPGVRARHVGSRFFPEPANDLSRDTRLLFPIRQNARGYGSRPGVSGYL